MVTQDKRMRLFTLRPKKSKNIGVSIMCLITQLLASSIVSRNCGCAGARVKVKANYGKKWALCMSS